MAEMMQLRKELSGSGNNLNQSIKKLHTLRDNIELLPWIIAHNAEVKRYLKVAEEIKNRINQFADKW